MARIIACSWLSKPTCFKLIIKAYHMIRRRKPQEAFVHPDAGIATMKPLLRQANAKLLKSCVLRTNEDLLQALDLAEEVVFTANLHNLHDLLCKAQLYRGLCLYEMRLYADAKACFIRAANINGFAREVPILTALAEDGRKALPDGSKGKQLGVNFREVPFVTLAKSFGKVSKG